MDQINVHDTDHTCLFAPAVKYIGLKHGMRTEKETRIE